jgi:hypothetical protein
MRREKNARSLCQIKCPFLKCSFLHHLISDGALSLHQSKQFFLQCSGSIRPLLQNSILLERKAFHGLRFENYTYLTACSGAVSMTQYPSHIS